MSKPKAVVARINLTNSSVELSGSGEYYEWLGGRGYGVRTVFKEVKKETHPFSPENKIVIATGCFSGTSLPGSSRIEIVAKNVYNNGISYSSGGGDFSPALKHAGIDALIIEGKAEKPVYLYVHDKQVEIKNAEALWGKTTWDTEDLIRERLKEKSVKVAAIGPAGENMAAMACVIMDKAHAAAWGGSGAILGSKNLKAIAAKPGIGSSIKMADPEKFQMETHKYTGVLLSSPSSAALKKGGTHAMAAAGGWSGKAPTSVRNSIDEYWDPEKNSKVKEEAYKKYEKKRTQCYNCPLACMHWYEIEDEGGKLTGEGMHANSVRGFSSNWDVDDPIAVFKAHILCNQYGMDVDGTSAVIAWAAECYEKGLINEGDTDGLQLKWGNAAEFITLIENIAHKKGFGAILSAGVYEAARVIGKNSLAHAMQVKKVGINEQSLRTHKAWSLSIGVSSRGSGHATGAPQTEKRNIAPEIGQWLFNNPEAGVPTSYQGKGKLVALFETYKAIVDSIGVCYFDSGWYELALFNTGYYVDMFNALTGSAISKNELWDIGKRILNIEKAINTVFAGFTREDDMLPERIMDVPISDGPYKGEIMHRDKYNAMLDEYYTEHGWDSETGMQKGAALRELGLSDVAEFLKL